MPRTMTINGKQVAGDRTFDVVNPATAEVVDAAPDCSPSELDAAMTGAQQAFESAWSRDEDQRNSSLLRMADLLEENADDIADCLTAEQGKPLRESRREMRVAAERYRYYASLTLEDEIVQDDDVARVRITRKPMGVVAAITPWNAPIVTAANKLAPALKAGNTVVLKPSPFTPLSTLQMGTVFASALPAGVLNVVTGADPLGRMMSEHPIPRRVTVTGSIATGRAVASAALKDFKRVTLELGGNDPAIVLDDADPAVVADGIFAASFANCGQICVAIKRLFVPEALYEELVGDLASRAKGLVVGNGADEATEMGPLATAAQRDHVAALVADAVASGASVAAGGQAIEGPGYFFAPTIIRDAKPGMRIVDEEQFGPALPVISYSSLDDAITSANSTEYGLGGSVWTSNMDRGRDVGARLQSGTVWINSARVLAAHQPFGAVKSSGIGVHGGVLGLHDCTDAQVMWEGKAASFRSGQ